MLEASRQGEGIAAIDLDPACLQDVVSQARQAGARDVLALESDVGSEQAVDSALRNAASVSASDCGPRECGIEINSAAHELALCDWSRTLDVNLTGAFLVARRAIAEMLAAGVSGSIVCTSSPAAFVGFAGGGNAAYAASKGGISAMVRSLALDYARAGIRVNCVVPGATDTPLLTAAVSPAERPRARDRIAVLAREQVPLGRLVPPRKSQAPSCGCSQTQRHM